MSILLYPFQRMMNYVWGIDMGPTRCPLSEPTEEAWGKVTALLDGMNFRGLAQQNWKFGKILDLKINHFEENNIFILNKAL